MNRNELIKVAKLYYFGNMSQEQVAKLMGVSRPKVSRMLSMAREQGIVEIHISESTMLKDQMQETLKSHLKLSKVIVVPSGATAAQSIQAAGAAANEYLNTVLCDGMYIGVSWGTTIDSVINHLTPARSFYNATVVQMLGGVRAHAFNIDSREVALTLAQRLKCNYSLLQAPLLVSSDEVRSVLLNEPEFAAHFRLFEKLDIALVGISSNVPERSVPYKAGYISLEQSRMLVDQGFATDICGNRLYQDGSIRTNFLTGRIVGISPDLLRAIPNVVAIAVGEDKASNIITASRGGFIKTLITDEVAAISILGLENIHLSPKM